MPQSQIIEQTDYHKSNAFDESLAMNVSIVDAENEFHNLKETWNSLNDASPKGTLFDSWEWLYTWWEVYKYNGNRKLFILTYSEENTIKAIAPFQIANNPKKYFPCSRQIILLGTGETDGSFVFGEYMDLIIQPGYENKAINAFSHFLLKHQSKWDGLKFHELLKGSYLSRMFQNSELPLIKNETSKGFRTLIDLPDSYKAYLMSLKKKMRNNITRTLNRLNNEQSYTVDTIENEDEAISAIKTLAELNRARRDNLEKDSAFEQPNFEEFHIRLARRLIPLNKISLRIMRFGNEPVAALYSFIDNDIIHPYQSGFEVKSGHRYSLLTTMLAKEIEFSIDHPDLERFNFMYSDEENTYKKRYSGTTETMYTLSFDKNGFKFYVYKFIHIHIKGLVKRLLKIE